MIKYIAAVEQRLNMEDPFLFCAHHLDHYPAGNGKMGIDAKFMKGRAIGEDFESKDGFRLYHGDDVPGFPVHPHRGFETITIARQGFVDHADSLGAAGRFGEGDVQWMTAGSGVQHSEMFPLINSDKGNTLEIFQIWLNLPKKNKMVKPDFKMIWANQIPHDRSQENVDVAVISGDYAGTRFFESPENSWAKSPDNCVNIFMIKMKAGGIFEFPKAPIVTNRMIYLFDGNAVKIGSEVLKPQMVAYLDSAEKLIVEAQGDAELLFLEGRPINEPVVQYGPFVMNTKQEILQAISDYQTNEFGGWSWDRRDFVHLPDAGRFAKYPDGRIEKPEF